MINIKNKWYISKKYSIILVLIFICLFIFFSSRIKAVPDDFAMISESRHLALYLEESTAEIAVKNKETGKIWFSNPARETGGRDLREIFSISYRNREGNVRRMDSYNHSVNFDQFEIKQIADGVRIEFVVGDKYSEVEHVLPQLIEKNRLDHFLDQIEDENDRATIRNNYVLISLEKREEERPEPLSSFQRTVQSVFGDYHLITRTDDFQELQKQIESLEDRLAEANRSSGEEPDEKINEENNNEVHEENNEEPNEENNQNPEETDEKAAIREELSVKKDQLEEKRREFTRHLFNKFVGEVVGVGGMTEGYRRDVDAAGDLAAADFAYLKENDAYMLKSGIAPFVKNNMEDILGEAGYTIDDLSTDHFRYFLDPPVPGIQFFEIPLEIRLKERSIEVNIPRQDIRYPQEMPEEYKINFNAENYEQAIVADPGAQKTTLQLLTVNILEGLGAATFNDQGYFMIPDGSGALIEFSESQSAVSPYNRPVFGPDYTVREIRRTASDLQQIHLPVFGVNKNGEGLLAIIEDGAAAGRIRADIPGRTRPFYTLFSSFETIPTFTSDTGDVTLNYHAPRLFNNDIRLNYVFLRQDKSDYTGMARYYQNYLKDQGVLQKTEITSIPLFMDLIGAVSRREASMGIMRDVSRPVTPFGQTLEIMEKIKAEQIDNVHLKMSGFLEGGLHHKYPSGINHESALGKTEELEKLVAQLKQWNYNFYPQVYLQNVYNTSLLDGFYSRLHSARRLNRQQARINYYDRVLFEKIEDEYYYLAAPGGLKNRAESFYDSFQEYGITGLNPGDLARYLYADYREREKRYVDRQQSQLIITDTLHSLQEERGLNLLLEEANSYTFAFTDTFINIPQQSSNYRIFDRDIPFIQIVLQGYAEYSGFPINLAPDNRESLLRNIETGGGLHFRLMGKDSSFLRKTRFDHLYDVDYQSWLNYIKETYHRVNDELGPAAGQAIEKHEKLQEDVVMTVFEEGTIIIVNYSEEAVQKRGHKIGGQDFIVLDGGED